MLVARATSDLHLSPVTARWVFAALDELRADAEERAGPTIIAGDILNIADEVHAETFTRLHRMFYEWPGDVIVIPGNHDQYNAQGNTILEALICPRVAVCPGPSRNELGLFAPYIPPSDFFGRVARVPKLADALPIWWTHQGWRGAYVNTMRRDRDGISPAQVDAEVVVSGHYHMPQGIGPIIYCGSPYQTTFAEEGQTKSWLRWDGSSLWPTRVPYTIDAPRHFTIRWNPEQGEPAMPAGARPNIDKIRILTEADRETARKAAGQLKRAGLDGVAVTSASPDERIRAIDSDDPWRAAGEWIAARGGDPHCDPVSVLRTATEHSLWRPE